MSSLDPPAVLEHVQAILGMALLLRYDAFVHGTAEELDLALRVGVMT